MQVLIAKEAQARKLAEQSAKEAQAKLEELRAKEENLRLAVEQVKLISTSASLEVSLRKSEQDELQSSPLSPPLSSSNA